MDIRGLTTCNRIIDYVTFHRTITRGQLGAKAGLSAASVTNYTRWLLDIGLISAVSMQRAHAIRPVDELWLVSERATGLAIAVTPQRVCGSLVTLGGTPITDFAFDVSEPTQSGVLSAIDAAARRNREAAADLHRQVIYTGICVDGVVSDGCSVFTVRGVPDWQPCDLNPVLDSLTGLGQIVAWTHVGAQAYGQALHLKDDSHVGYLRLGVERIALASVYEAHLSWGLTGAAESWFHTAVADAGPPCYCRRIGCLAPFLKQHRADVAVVERAVPFFRSRMRNVTQLTLEWDGNEDAVIPLLQRGGFQTVSRPGDRLELLRRGLHVLVAAASAKRVIAEESARRRGRRSAGAPRRGERKQD